MTAGTPARPVPGRGVRHIQVVSRQFPLDFAKASHGIFQRLHVMLEACRDTGARIDALFLVPAVWLRDIDVATHQRLFEQHWGIPLTLRLAGFADPPAASWVSYYLAPMLSAERNEDYEPTAALQGEVDRLLDWNADLVLAHKLHAALPVLKASARRTAAPPVVVDVDDIEHRKLFRELRRPPYWAGKLLKFLHVPAIALAECRSVRQAAASLVCSTGDQRYLRRLTQCERVALLPNSVDLGPVLAEGELPPLAAEPTLLFVGTYTHRPNVDAAEFLMHRVFPLVRARLPQARLLLVGPRIEVLPSHGQPLPGVEFRGFVENLAAVWRSAGVMCCTILAGGGTRIKIIESAAQGVPVVSTTVGAEGLEFTDGRDILLRDDPAGLADACVRLLQDRPLAERLRRAARAHVQRFDRRRIVADLAQLLQQAASGSAQR